MPSALERDANGDRAGAGAHIQYCQLTFAAQIGECGFHQMLGFRAGDQYAAVHEELAAKELLAVSDVLGGLSLQPFVQVAAVVNPRSFR